MGPPPYSRDGRLVVLVAVETGFPAFLVAVEEGVLAVLVADQDGVLAVLSSV